VVHLATHLALEGPEPRPRYVWIDDASIGGDLVDPETEVVECDG